MKLSIIVINYHTEVLLKQCLDSLFNNYSKDLNNQDFEIIIVNNDVSLRSFPLLSSYESRIKIIHNNENNGYAKANNQGIKQSKGDYILLLNPDTVVYKNSLNTVLKYLENNQEVGVATCKVMLPNGNIDDASHRGFPTPWRALTYFLGLGKIFHSSMFFNGYHLGYKNMDKIHEIDSCVGAFMMMRKQVGEQVRWLDEDYFWYGDDLDLCYRVKKAGYKIIYIPLAAILHYKGVSSGLKKHSQHLSSADKQTKFLATNARFEAMRIFYKKHYMKIYPSFLTKLIFIGINIKEKINKLII